ncbi:hypothetical protein F5X96DRAFT_656965 [Biscogniauxia mediterranea]|nr:hypothetical protein F5X96DRAFT_656965 [Biscogniauxia mediterranea]
MSRRPSGVARYVVLFFLSLSLVSYTRTLPPASPTLLLLLLLLLPLWLNQGGTLVSSAQQVCYVSM